MELAKITFTDEQVSLIKSQIAPKATDNELKLFLYQAKRTGLDPLTRQIYAIHRWNQQQGKEMMTIQTSIDGFRVIAERSGDYGGQDEPEFLEENGKLIACKVRVYRFKGDQRYQAAVGVAYWSEYCQTTKEGKPMGLWAKMPHTMLSKVAEALALRKAYPHDLSGIYTTEEMNQAEPVQDSVDRSLLFQLLETSTLTDSEKKIATDLINSCTDAIQYGKILNRLKEKQ
jgi:phage recombination protein Bet